MDAKYWFDLIVEISQMMATIVAGAGLFYVSRQIKETRRFTRANLLNTLDSEFRDHLYTTFVKLRPGGAFSSSEYIPSNDDMMEIRSYLSFFEQIQLLIENDAMDAHTVAVLFGARLRAATTNHHVQRFLEESDEVDDFESFRLLRDKVHGVRASLKNNPRKLPK